jgi:hypothetical protein
MKIETKYNVGDTVWIPKLDRGSGIYLPEEKNIEEIAIYIRKKSNINIIYFFPLLPFNGFDADELYATKEECQEVCDKKNKMGRR